jgi:hypothetical protein
MQHHLRLMILTATLLSFIGCGQKETVQIQTPAKAASQMEQAFANADAETKQSAQAVASALKASDYEKAYVVLQTVQYRPNLTYEQAMAARDSMFSLQKQLAEASLRGDTNAQSVIEMIRRTQPR